MNPNSTEFVDRDACISPARHTTSRILLIDDDPAYLFLCKRFLHSDDTFRHSVVAACSVQEALDVCEADVVDCIVIDYCLPDKTGTEVISLLRERLGHDMPPAIVLTADGGEEAATEAVRSGASDFLAKRDVTKESICRAVKNTIEKDRLRKSLMCRVRELEAANALLLKRSAEIQRFYHTVSHEVKTPLTAIQEFVSIVADGLVGPVEEEQKKILDYALESCLQISSHFNDLLELSRFETGKLKIDPKPSDIHAVLEHCIMAARSAAQAKGINLSMDDNAELPMVMMQSNRIIQVLSNLLNNAIKFTSAGGSITIKSQVIEEGRMLRLSVVDTGCGIPASDTSNVFERLFQVNPTYDQDNGPGLGLGLSIASEIVALHGGELSVESELGIGSEFSFTLPVSLEQEDSLSDAA